MFSLRLKFCVFTAVALLTGTAAQAADIAVPPPPPPVVHDFGGGWYLRGQVGVGMLSSDQVEFQQNPNNFSNFVVEHSDIADTYFIGGGVGYEFNRWLRFDATAEYRSRARVSAFGSYTFGGGTFGDSYEGYIKSWVFLANAYVDLGTWNCLTPFVGAGVGGAWTQLADFTDIGIGTSGRGIGRNSSEWHPAWALYAGLAYDVSPNLKIDLTYRYLDYGSITDTIDCIGGCNPDSYKWGHLTSQDIMLGLRFNCCDFVETRPLRSRG
jgi:opacity protein-like surface antigen